MKSKLSTFFKVITQNQTYLNLAFLLLSFPLGIFYFTFITTALSLGIGLTITLFGIPILIGTLLLCRVLAVFEIQQIKTILGTKIAYDSVPEQKGFLKKIKFYMGDSFTWRSLAYLFIKFPLGITSFVTLVTLISVSLSLIAVPFLYHLSRTGILPGVFCEGPNVVCSLIGSYFNTIMIGIIGILLFFTFLHALNGLAYISGILAKSILGKKK